MHRIMNWNGAGWYTCQQEGAYENVSIRYYWVGGEPDQPEGYGNLTWYSDPSEFDGNVRF